MKKGPVIAMATVIAILAIVASTAIGYIFGMKSEKGSDNKNTLQEDTKKETGTTSENTSGQKSEVATAEGVSTHGHLRVENATLVDENGEEFQLRGVSTHGIAWFPEYSNYASVKSMKDRGANVFRIATYSADANKSYAEDPERARQLTDMAIENVLAADMYAIVDWHVLEDKNPLNHTGEAMQFFEHVASTYGNEPGIIYEICNEPNGDTSWENIRDYANQIIPVIRKYAEDAVIIVGTPEYSYCLDPIFSDLLTQDNLMYTFHFYAGQHSDGDYESILSHAKESGIAIFVTEWGINYAGDNQPALDSGKAFVKYLNENKISWAAWSLCNKDEVFSLLKPDCRRFSGYKDEDFTEVGKVILDGLK